MNENSRYIFGILVASTIPPLGGNEAIAALILAPASYVINPKLTVTD
jgi:hypothetical protein